MITYEEVTNGGNVFFRKQGEPGSTWGQRGMDLLEAEHAAAGTEYEIVEIDEIPVLSARERRGARYAVELSNGNPTPIEALADNQSALITEVADLRQLCIDLVDELRLHNIPVNPTLFGAMTPNLAERIQKIETIQAEET